MGFENIIVPKKRGRPKKDTVSDVKDRRSLVRVKNEDKTKIEGLEDVYRDIDGELVVGLRDVCKIFGVNQDTVSNWCAKRGCPQKGHNQYRLCDIYSWRNNTKLDKSTSPEAKKLQAEADYKEAKARQEEVRLKEMLGELVDLEILKGELSTCFTNIRQMLLKLPNSVRVHVHTLYPESATGISEIVEDEIRKTLDELGRCGNTATHTNVEGEFAQDDKSSVGTLCSTTKDDSK